MTPNSSPVPGPRAPSRRSFLTSATVAAAAVAGGASFLTACGSSDSGKREGHLGQGGPEGVRRVAASGLADGVILMDVELDDPRIPVLREQGTQAALIGLPDDSRQLSCVDHDFAAAGALRADHLGNLGHRDIAFIGYGSRDLRTARRVRRTHPRRVRRAGRTARPALPAPPLRGHVREHRPGSRPHLRRAAGNHRVRRAERGGDLRVGTVQGTGPGHHPWFQHPPANSPTASLKGLMLSTGLLSF